MTQLVALLGYGKGSWAHVSKLISQADVEEVFLFTNEFGKEKFRPDEKTKLIVVDFKKDMDSLVTVFYKHLKPVIAGVDVALNFVSGEGPEHMALLAAILKMGVGVRLVVAGEKNFIEL